MRQKEHVGNTLSKQTAGRRKPRITQEMRVQARTNPEGWLYVIDDPFGVCDRVSLWSIVGAFPIDSDGVIIDDFSPNEWYRPSPKTLGLPDPVDELECALQLVYARHRSAADLASVILDAKLYIYAFSPDQQSVIGLYAQDGSVTVPAYTSASRVPDQWPQTRSVRGRDMIDLLSGHSLMINPNDTTAAALSGEELRHARDRLC